MSRAGGDDYEEDFAGQAALWRANLRRHMKGQRGQQMLRDLREALHALPERRLISDAFSTVGVTTVEVPEKRPPSWGEDGFDFAAYRAYQAAEDTKELLAEQGVGMCSVAAYVWHQKVKAGADPQEAMAELPLLPDWDSDWSDTTREGRAAGLSSYLAYEFMWNNDERFSHLTPEARWVAVVEWIDQALAGHVDA